MNVIFKSEDLILHRMDSYIFKHNDIFFIILKILKAYEIIAIKLSSPHLDRYKPEKAYD